MVITIYMLPDWVTCKIGALSIQRTVVTSRHLWYSFTISLLLELPPHYDYLLRVP